MIYIKSKDNPFIKHLNKLNKSPKYRRENREFVAEGVRLCTDAALSNAEIKAVAVCEDSVEKYSSEIETLKAVCDKVYCLSKQLFRDVSETKTPQGVLCVVKTLDKPTLFDKMVIGGKFVALDNIQDPSNLGTVMRTAEAVGVDGIILSSDCCDIYSPKVVRGSMGAVFRLPCYITEDIASFLSMHRELKSYASVVDKEALKITDIAFESPCVVIIGNEGNGIKSSTLENCDEKFTIPMNGRAESLNASAAAAIIIWELIK